MKKPTSLLLTITLVFNIVNAQDLVFSETVDLNSDNKDEKIKLENRDDAYDFKLIINDKEVFGQFYDGMSDGFLVIDVNKYDKFKEIAVHTPGPSSDDEYIIYWYNGEEIVFMDH